MELLNYNRVYSLTVGEPAEYTLIPDPTLEQLATPTISVENFLAGNFVSEITSERDARVVETTSAVEIRDLQLQATITNSSESVGEAGNTTIKIFNVPKSKLSVLTKKNSFVILKAGYSPQLGSDGDYSSLPMIFSGQISYSETKFMGGDVVTTITCKEGFTPSNSIKISVNLSPNNSVGTQTYEDIFKRLISIWKANGLSVSEESVILDTPSFTTKFAETTAAGAFPQDGLAPTQIPLDFGWSYEGFLRDAMDDLCSQFNYTWYIGNNILYIHSKNFKDFVIKYTFKQSQILDIKDAVDSRGIPTEGKSKRIKLKSLLDGRLTSKLSMGNQLEIPDGDFRGTYSVKSISYRLDWRGNDWYNEVEAEAIT